MRLGRILTSLFAAAVVFSATTAVAANVAVSTHSIGAGGAAVSSCGSGFGVTYNLGTNNVVASVTITNIPTNCNNGTIRVALTDESNNLQGSGSASAGTTGSATVSVSDSPQAANIKKVFMVIEGGGS